MKLLRYFIAPAALALTLVACKKESGSDLPYQYQSDVLNLPEQPYNYSKPNLPDHMFDVKERIGSKVTDAGATLGRVLFYDPKLSLNNKTACASCHLQAKGFADPVAFSRGFDGGLTKRNASSIVNPIDNASFFWDARETDIKAMVLRPIENHVEMGMDNFAALEKKLGSLGYYKPLFEAAFGDKEVTEARIAEGLSQFLNSIVSGNSKMDGARPNGWGVDVPSTFTIPERNGMDLFLGKARCVTCHSMGSANVFGQSEQFANIGLDLNPSDKGLGATVAGMDGAFKIPSLRNVALTGPYMHDGRFKSLEEVVDHYNEKIQPVANLHWGLQDGTGNGVPTLGVQPVRMNLSAQEKSDLIAFLNTFTDESFLADQKYSNPFK